jgi:threonyl-tRNA synthetase
MLVIGEKEAAIQSVSVRHAKRGDLGVRPLDEFLTDLVQEVASRSL